MGSTSLKNAKSVFGSSFSKESSSMELEPLSSCIKSSTERNGDEKSTYEYNSLLSNNNIFDNGEVDNKLKDYYNNFYN